MRRSWPLLGLLLWHSACAPVRTVTPNPVPTAEPLRAADCEGAVRHYQELLARPPVGPLDRPRPDLPGADVFAATCEEKLVGHTRRAVLRCWKDAESAAAFLSCNDRF